MNKYRVAFLVKDYVDGVVINADYYLREDMFVNFIKVNEDRDDEEVFSIKTEHLISITKI